MTKRPNNLINEKSPYLLQHAYNPVNWFPWCNEAFQKASEEDKPIFLSIGYSTCHWCHVMEKESFEDRNVASIMNEHFVSVKVDREERPDIDGIYMNVCQMLTGSGGWPLTIIMTPDKKPFFAGTYFPKQGRFGRIGMLEMLPQIKNIWDEKRNEINKSTENILSSLQSYSSKVQREKLDQSVLKKAFEQLSGSFDKDHGGFGSAPKFPTPHNLIFLLKYSKKFNDQTAIKIVEKTLTQMKLGGIYDHIGFGFSRYSTDREWLVPHFEKMLYDQALLTLAYIQTYLLTKNSFYKDSANEILTYVLRDLSSQEGGFYSAEDADSEEEEGKFYLWAYEELKSLLTDDEFEFTVNIFNIKKDGNWIDSVHGGKNGTNILHLKKSKSELSEELKIPLNVFENKFETVRQKLFDARNLRIHPYKDDKILTDWNGLMISAFANAAQAFNDDKYSQAAINTAEFILNNMSDNNGRLHHRYREGEAAIYANINDYAFFIQGLIDIYETVFEENYLIIAIELTNHILNHFWDEKNGAFYFTADYSEKLIIRPKEIYDGAIPSGNSISALNLLRLGRMTGYTLWEEKAMKILDAFSSQIKSSPSVFTQSLIALDFAIGPAKEIIIVGNKNSDLVKEMITEIHSWYIPNKIILLKEEKSKLTDYAAFLNNYNVVDGKPAVYVCENYMCKMPVDNINDLKILLSNSE